MIIFNRIDKRKTFKILFLFLYLFCAVFILDVLITLLSKLYNKPSIDFKKTCDNNTISEESKYLKDEHNKIVYEEIEKLLKKNLVSKALDLFSNSLIVYKNDEKYIQILHAIKQKFVDKNISMDFANSENNKKNIHKLLLINPENIDLLMLEAQYVTAYSQYKYHVNIDESDFDMLINFSRFLEKTFITKEYLKDNFNLQVYIKKKYIEYCKLNKSSTFLLFKKSDLFKKQYGDIDINFIPNDLSGLNTILKKWLIQYVYDFITFLTEQGYYEIAKTYFELYYDTEMYSGVSIADYIALSDYNEKFELLNKELNYTYTNKLNNNLDFDDDLYEEREYWWGLDGWQFEQQVAKVFEAIGYKADVTKGSGDGGVDIILTKDNYRAIVQCKHHTDPVKPEAIRALYGVKKDFHADEVIMVASVGATPSGYDFIKDKPDYKLYTLDDIIKMSEKIFKD